MDDLADAFVDASRALVAVAARSLAAVDHLVTPPQYRLLLVISMRPAPGVKELAAELRVQPSTVTRMCDRLVTKGLVERVTSERDRREIELRVTATGRRVVATVTRRRRQEIERILRRIGADHAGDALRALRAFSSAADEGDDVDATVLGWR